MNGDFVEIHLSLYFYFSFHFLLQLFQNVNFLISMVVYSLELTKLISLFLIPVSVPDSVES